MLAAVLSVAAAGAPVSDGSAGVGRGAALCPVGLGCVGKQGTPKGAVEYVGQEPSIPAAQTPGARQRRVSEIPVSTKHFKSAFFLLKMKAFQEQNTFILFGACVL